MTFPLYLALALITGPALAENPKPPKKASAPKKVERTWSSLVDHMMTHGADHSINAPASRTLGYDSDKIPVKAMYLDQDKSKDGREHSLMIVYDLVDGRPRPKEMVLGRIKVVEKDKIQEIVSNRLILRLNGEPIRGMGADGIVGEVKQRPLTADTPEAKKFLADESSFWLKQVDLSKLENDY
ncbi:MAG: hypothetical protein HY923_05440 [Elusimicrobia bacterium]|nr:hypothetical protein [Elusimicrobiota bacterium]